MDRAMNKQDTSPECIEIRTSVGVSTLTLVLAVPRFLAAGWYSEALLLQQSSYGYVSFHHLQR